MFNFPLKLISLFLFLQLPFTSSANFVLVEAEKGFVDFKDIDFEHQFVRLSGEWEFYYENYYSPLELNHIDPTNKTYGEVPGFWKHYDQGLSRFGYATYKLTFDLSEEQLNIPIGLRINNIHNAFKLYLNGELIAQVGEPGKTKASTTSKWLPLVLHLNSVKRTNDLVVHVCNFRHRNGGIQDAFEFGLLPSFEKEYKHQMISELFLAGACFILGCFFIGMFFFWKKDRAALHFGIFSFFFSVRILLVGTRSLVYAFPDIPWDVSVRLEYISMFCMHYFMFHFVFYAFEKYANRTYLNVLKIVTAVYLVISLIPGDMFTYLTIVNNYYLLTTFIYTIIIFIKALRANEPGSIWAILSMALFFITTIPMVLEYSNLFITDPVILNLAYIGFMLFMSLVFASRFSFAFLNLEDLKNSEQMRSVEISRQKDKAERNNKLINESINYAQRIQQSLLPSDNLLRNIFGECFIMFKPQGKVSGDFYWCKQRKDKKEALISVVDCTGHGVPGTFISLIAISGLDYLVDQKSKVETDELLIDINDLVHDRLRNPNESSTVIKEGLDIGLCKINFEQRKVCFSGAHHKMLLVRHNGDFHIYQGDRHIIGMPLSFDFKFTKYEIDVEPGDQIYLFTDGVYDQKGGDEGKKLYLKPMIERLLMNRHLPMHRQKIEFEEFIENWMGDKEQMDDMIVFGIKISE